MKVKLVHPIWTKIPSVTALTLLVVYIFTNGPFPARVAVHFGAGGEPNAYGSPWSVFGLVIGISVLFIGISVLIDELWARQEKVKMFNWFSLLDDIVVGTMVGITLGYLTFLQHTIFPKSNSSDRFIPHFIPVGRPQPIFTWLPI